MTRPRLWKYLLAALLLTPVAAGFILYGYGLEDSVNRYEEGKLGFLWWLALPLAVLLAAYGWRYIAAEQTQAKAEAKQAAESKAAANAEATKRERREYSLEVLLLGLSVDKFRQHE